MRKEVRRSIAVASSIVFMFFLGISPSHAEDLKKLATDLSARIHSAKRVRVTVVDFVDLDKKPTKLGKYLAQQLQATLAEPEYKIDVVDQSHLGQLMDQMEKLSEGLIDQATGQQLGKMAGTQVLIVGTVMPSSLTVRLDVKAIDLLTAKVIVGEGIGLPRLGIVDRLASASGDEEEASDNQPSKGKTGAAAHGGSGKSASHAPTRTRRDQNVDFELDGCSLSGDALTCSVTVTSEGRDRWLSVGFESRAWNDSGDEYGPGDITIANLSRQENCTAKEVLKGVPTRMTLTFPQFGADASSVERLRLAWYEAERCCCFTRRPVEFEKISISDNTDYSLRNGAHAVGGRGGSQSSGERKGKGGLLDSLKDRALDIFNKRLDKETRKLSGDDDKKPPQP